VQRSDLASILDVLSSAGVFVQLQSFNTVKELSSGEFGPPGWTTHSN